MISIVIFQVPFIIAIALINCRQTGRKDCLELMLRCVFLFNLLSF